MTLQRKFVLWIAALMCCVIALGSVSIWNLVSMRRAATATAAEYDAMDRAEATAVQVAWLRDVLRGPSAANYRDAQFFAPIEKQVIEIVRELRLAEGIENSDGAAELKQGLSASDHLSIATRRSSGFGEASKANDAKGAEAAADELEKVRTSLLAVARLVPGSARRQVAGAADSLLARIQWTCLSLLIVLVISGVIHLSQYRALVRPLLSLREDMRRSAAREYKDEIAPRGDREFRDVATVFNGLARELSELYRSLDEKVITRSRELVRSERLASVGFLAAGVAHEINNPLSVISGYAELATKSLTRVMNGERVDGRADEEEAEAEALSNVLDAQGLIRDEAFRCKEITNRLLSLARGGADAREPLQLDGLARQVAALTRGLRDYRDRQVVLDFESGSLEVIANATEMKQVLLNLTVNALEAVPPQRGEVKISGRRTGDWVELSITDNGKGMNAQTLQNVFEPFFTAKRGEGEPGTGLGLSITHAIIENHGGRIRAESAGAGKGSRFIVRLPARQQAAAEAAAAFEGAA